MSDPLRSCQSEDQLSLSGGGCDLLVHAPQAQDALRVLMASFKEVYAAQKGDLAANPRHEWVVRRSQVNVIVSKV